MRILIIILISSFLFSAQYSIIAFSTKNFNLKAAKLFIKRFPNGIVKQYTRFVEYKIEPFNSYKEAKEFLKKVKKYYKYPLIIKYNPNLGKILYPYKINKQQKIVNKNNTKMLIHCKNECGCIKTKKYNWEINKTKIINKINIKIKKYLEVKNLEKNKTSGNVSISKNTKVNENNKSKYYDFYCKFPSTTNILYYIDLYGNLYKGQKNEYQKKGDNENIKFGLMYERYFFDNWKFFTDDRIILSRKNISGNKSNNIYLDVNELYFRSYCLMCNYLDILIGRKKTKDFKSWWFDNSLDEVKLFNENSLLTFEIIGATRINNNIITNENSSKANIKNSGYLISHINYEFYYKNNAGIYYIYEDANPKDTFNKQRGNYIGVYAHGEKSKIKYWLNIGYANGKRDYLNYSKKFNGYGLDVGGIYFINYKNGLGVNFAYGQNKFTQPLIATNYSNFLQRNINFHYYGMIFNPILENINIFSLYWIYNINNFETLIALLNSYQQNKKSINNYNTTYLFETNGKSKHLGEEFNIIYQYLNSKSDKFKLGLGYFIGGNAYDYLENKNAYRIFLNYRHYWK
ncbi:alginate export family protein [Caminibacter mediatlanticus]|uniref:Alginate export domain-containing protein n=1 Tax=Caminibacter mediatlanticus TB-2 TaxID=391592 RepID=A0AAI9AJ31_9BACT|nr:alginate export family protein [Caminibacter mediatlanticus]EDM24593.1 hypothetical protein CMTB2_03718 [Caminibacter mediatlanticus TB-2]